MVIVFREAVDLCDEVLDTLEGAAADGLLGDQSEPSFDLIEPGRISGRVVDVESGSRGQPKADLGVLMGGVVIDDQMHVERCRDCLVDALDEAEKLLMPVAWFALGQHGSGGDVECGE